MLSNSLPAAHLQQHLLTLLRAWRGRRTSPCPWPEVMKSAGLMASSWERRGPLPRGAAGRVSRCLLWWEGGKFCLRPTSCLLLCRKPRLSCFVGG